MKTNAPMWAHRVTPTKNLESEWSHSRKTDQPIKVRGGVWGRPKTRPQAYRQAKENKAVYVNDVLYYHAFYALQEFKFSMSSEVFMKPCRPFLAPLRLASASFNGRVGIGFSKGFAQATLPYQDRKLPVEQRVQDLLSRMTLQEKVAQLESAWENSTFFKDPQMLFVDEKGAFLAERAAVILKDGLGEFSRPSDGGRGPRAMADFTNTVQKWVKDNTAWAYRPFPRRMSSWPCRRGWNFLSSGNCTCVHLGSRSPPRSFHRDGC